MAAIQNFLETLSDFIWSTPSSFPFIVVLLLFTGFLLTLKTRAIQIRKFFRGWKILLGIDKEEKKQGDISHFQAISAALSATVGIGNIAGVATAIHYGGPGALFWMWITAILGMAIKFGSATLGIKHRELTTDGDIAGGPMYYIKDGLSNKFTWMAFLFAAMLMVSALGIGNTIQSFTIADQMRSTFSIPTWVTGLGSAIILAIVIIGGIRRIGKVVSILTPFMCILYIISGVIILILNFGQIPETFALIFRSAFTHSAQVGGFAGAGFMYMLVWGVKRGLFSNEAGQGSAPVVFAAAKTDQPAREGMVAMIGPFIDTIMVCTITGLVILSTGVWQEKRPATIQVTPQNDITAIKENARVNKNSKIKDKDIIRDTTIKVSEGKTKQAKFIRNHGSIENAKIIVNDTVYTGILYIDSNNQISLKNKEQTFYLKGKMMQNGSPLTAWAFQKGLFGDWGGILVSIAVLLFGISTSISWSYYGNRGAYFIFGKDGSVLYKWIFVIANFIGAIVSLEAVWAFGDVAVGLMAIPNLVALILLSGVIKKEANKYESK